MRRPVMLLCVVALVGCGGRDAMSEEEFRAEGKRICDESAKRTKQVVEDELAKPQVYKLEPEERQLHLMKVAAKDVDRSLKELEALDAPEEAEPHVETLTEGLREVTQLVTDGKTDGSDEVTRLAELAAETRKAAKAAGLEACLPENAG